jgi:hypothetical protein
MHRRPEAVKRAMDEGARPVPLGLDLESACLRRMRPIDNGLDEPCAAVSSAASATLALQCQLAPDTLRSGQR